MSDLRHRTVSAVETIECRAKAKGPFPEGPLRWGATGLETPLVGTARVDILERDVTAARDGHLRQLTEVN